MADNAAVKSDASATLFTAACDEVTYSGDTTKVQIVRLAHVSGSEGSKTFTEIVDTTGVKTHEIPTTAGGLSRSHLVAAGSGDATAVKASAGQLYAVDVFNVATTPRYVKFHNSTAAPTVGSGVVLTVGVQAGVGRQVSWPNGVEFSTGIAMSLVTGIADNSTAAVTAADLVVDVFYK